SQGSIAFTLLTGPTDFDSVASNGSAGVGISSSSTGSLAMSRSCYDMASSGSISASSTARRSKHSRRRGSAAASNTPTVSVEYVDDGQTDSVEDNPISAEVDAAEGDEAGPRIIRKGRRYTPDRAALATPSPKVVLKRGYSPVLTSTNASSPDLLSAARISGSSRSLQLAARSPISSPMTATLKRRAPLLRLRRRRPPQSVTIVRQNGLFISEKLTTNFLQTPSTVSRLLQKSNTKFSKFSSFPTTSNVDAIDGAAADQTPVVKNALLKAGEQRQQMEQQQKVFSSNERRAQSVEGLDSRLGMSSPPPPPSVDDKQQDINAVFNITIERCPEGKQQQQQQQQQFMLLHSAATAGSLDDASGNSPKQSGLKLFKNFGDRLWRAKDAKQQQQQQPLHLVYNPPRSPEPPAVSAVASGSFGLPLHRCPKGSNGVPLIVQLCCRVIECGAIRREGIYRISGNSRNIEALEAELSKPVQDLNPNCELWLEYNVVASVLKRFLLQLPDPLIPAIYYNEFIVTQKLSDHRNRMLKLHRLLGVMEEHTDHPQHRCHRLTLQYLVNHLGLVSQYSAYNRMQFYNLAMVFAPSLFGQRTQENMLMHSALLIKLTKSIIQFRDWLFTDWEIADQCVPQLSEAEDEASANPTDTDTANPQQQQPPDPEADRRRVREVVHELMTEAKAVAAAAGDDDGSPPSRAAAAQPQYRERDIDAEIDRRLAAESAETAATSREELTATETTDEATDATDAEKDLTDGVEPELSDKQQQQQHDRLLQDVEQLSLTVERLSRESQSNLEHLRHERELVDDRLRKAEADLLDSNSGRLSNSQSSDRLPDPRPSSPDDVDVDLVDDSDHRQHIGKTAGAGRLVSDATV
uniref:Rho-GAP domain-containing protein n=1 Tax=Macrostomum lignano TaxID=282301 RepID=A0A1I8HXN3_9PLAT